MADENDADAQTRREAYYNRECLCGHAFGNHSMLSGCLLCNCGGATDKPRTVEYTRLTEQQ